MESPFPYRDRYGAPRPARLAGLPLPPARMPLWRDGRPLKRWRYAAAFAPELALCAGDVHIGPLRQSFWAVWDRRTKRLYERTRLLGAEVSLAAGRVRVTAPGVAVELVLEEQDGIETLCPHGRSWVWTRKQAAVPARGTVALGGAAPLALAARAVIDDTAGYHARHTEWRWSAGVGTARDGRAVGWNLVAGVNDPPRGSERTVWVDGEPREVGACRFAPDLAAVETEGARLDCAAEAVRTREENLLLGRSSYRQPFGTFSGRLPGGIELAEGYGVMEEHAARW